MITRGYLGLDLGTSALKAVLVSAAGDVLVRGSGEYPIRHPVASAAEQDSADWWVACVDAVRQIVTKAPAIAVAGIGLSGQMHGTVLLGADQTPLAPAIIWPDRRSADEVQQITERVGRERLLALTGSPAATGFQAATLGWLRQASPERWRHIRTVLLPKDELRRRLTGTIATDPSDASGTLLFDVRHRTWSADMLAKLEIDPRWLPQVQPSAAQAGSLLPAAAAEFGLPAGLPVMTGAADTAAGLLGAAVLDEQTMLVSIGTGGQVLIPARQPVIDPSGRSHTFCSALEPAEVQPGWYRMGAILAAGMALRWLRDRVFSLAEPDAYDRMNAWAANVPAGAGGLLFLPYLVGERTPHMDPAARGLFLGLTEQHGQAELTRAVLEGITFACRDAFVVLAERGAQPTRIVLAGGGARSPLWQQIFADVFGLPVVALHTSEQSALGAALLAATGSDRADLTETAKSWVRYGPEVTPDAARHALYEKLFALYRAAYEQNKASFAALTAMARSTPPPPAAATTPPSE